MTGMSSRRARFALHLRFGLAFTALFTLAWVVRLMHAQGVFATLLGDPSFTPPPNALFSTPPRHVPADRLGVAEQGRSYRVAVRMAYRNQSDGPLEVRMELPVPETRGARQHAGRPRMEPAPRRCYRDWSGNLLAEFRFASVPAGATVRARIEAVVKTAYWLDDVDSRAVMAPQGGGLPAVQRYLSSDRHFPAADAMVRQRLREVVRDEANPYFKALRIYDSIRMLRFQIQPTPLGVAKAARLGTVQCSDAAALFVAMARAADIPARYRGGFFIREDGPAVTRDSHAWAEFYLYGYGWVAVDPTMARFDDALRLSRFGQLLPGYVDLWGDRDDIPSCHVRRQSGARGPLEPRSLGVAYEWRASGPPPSPQTAPPRAEPLATSPVLTLVGRWSDLFPLPAPSFRSDFAGDNAGEGGLLLRAGLQALKEAQFSRAAGSLESAISIEDTPEAHLDLAVYLVRSKQVSRAFDELRTCLERQPGNYTAWHELVGLYAALELWEATLEAARRAAMFMPDEVEFPWAAGQASMRLKRYPQACRALERAVKLAPGIGGIHALYGWSLEGCGHVQQALDQVRLGLRLGVPDAEKAYYEAMERRLAGAVGAH